VRAVADEPGSVLADTGRIQEPLPRRVREMLFGASIEEGARDEFPFYVQIDRAHLVMLAEQGVLDRDRARRLLDALDELVSTDYASLRGRTPLRGAYLLYEHALIERLGQEVGGAVHLARSRNDINATVLRLRVRAVYRRLMGEGLRLVRVLTRRAEQYIAVTMPIHTHYQAALPITYGHYLAGVALALLRDLRWIEDAVQDLDRCPLGAGAAGGSAVAIDCARTASLLGFRDAVLHSVDAVAARDLVLRLLGAASVLGVTLSRLSTDLQLWSTAEFNLIRFPDALVGSSSMMPQKRNAFLLEHITGRAGSPLGAFTAAAVATHATPFTNSVAVGTEAVKHLWPGLRDLTDALILARVMVAGAQPDAREMRRRAVDGFTCATELANQLVLEGGLSFRKAHHRVGEAAREAVECGETLAAAAQPLLRQHGLSVDVARLDPDTVAARAERGGGPAAASVHRVLTELRRHSSARARALAERSRRWKAAGRQIDAAVRAFRRE